MCFQYLFCDLFYFLEGITESSYADDTTPYSANKTYDLVIKELEHFSEVPNCLALFQIIWLHENKNKSCNIDNTLKSENKDELLVVIIDSKLSFQDHINSLCKEVSQKLNAWVFHTCVSMKRKIVMKSFVMS